MNEPSASEERYRKALKQIRELRETWSGQPPVSIIGHRDPWARIGAEAVKIARKALEE